jgi:PIN domain nuclease of toxin-antitoxin system
LRLLLDTSIFIYLAFDPDSIPAHVRKTIDAAESRVLSVASAWEIAIKTSIGKLALPLSADEWVRSRASRMLVDVEPVRLEHATAIEVLPLHHRDPFDRLLIAHAVFEDRVLVTQDRRFEAYSVRLLRAWN